MLSLLVLSRCSSQGGYGVTPPCYGHMTHMLKALANGKLVVVLEVSRDTVIHEKLEVFSIISSFHPSITRLHFFI